MSTSRKYSNEAITVAIKDLFRAGKAQSIAIQSLRHIAQARRPANNDNLRNIVHQLQDGFRATECVVVWEDNNKFFVCYGDQRFRAVEQHGTIRSIPCLVLRGKPNPSIVDLCYANLVSAALGPHPAKRSGMSKIIELRTMISWILFRQDRPSLVSISSSDVTREILNIYGGASSTLYARHWSKGLDATRIRKMVFIAKCCMLFKLEDYVDQCERIAPNPDDQVSIKVLYKIMKLQKHDHVQASPQGLGKLIFQRFISLVESSSRPGKEYLKLTIAEEELFQHIVTSDSAGSTSGNATGGKRATLSRGRAALSQAFSKCEHGVSKLQMGYNGLKNGQLTQEELDSLKHKIADVQSYVHQLKSKYT